MSAYHTPVLLDESVSALITDTAGVYVDATFGGGGHSAEILARLSAEGRLIAFDKDSEALGNSIDDDRLTLVHADFRFIRNFARYLAEGQSQSSDRPAEEPPQKSEISGDPRTTGTEPLVGDVGRSGAARGFQGAGCPLTGILADLGVSSHQFDSEHRGFSFRFEDAPLDMRMNAGQGKGMRMNDGEGKNTGIDAVKGENDKTAATVVNTYPEEELEKIFRIYGEVENSRALARLIVSARTCAPIRTTGDLDRAIEKVTPKAAPHKYLAKVYQALRITVNDEMRSLEKFLEGAAASLCSGGRLVVITYHSLEDRMVKNFIKAGNIDGELKKDTFGRVEAPLRAVNRKPILPSEEEIAANTRARSAKLRIAEKL